MRNLFFLSVFSFLFLMSCSEDNNTGTNPEMEEADYSQILNDYVDNTVIPTYADMKNQSMLLYEAVSEFKESGEQADLQQACDYWKATRKPWEASEAFLYGPAAYRNLDPLLDSWPLDQAQLDQVLGGSQELTADYVRNALGAVLRGFHTVEYLLFRDGAPRSVSDITGREREYLVAVTEVLRDDCLTLWAAWNGVEEGTDEAEILAAIDVEVEPPFGEVMKSAGSAGSEYLSQTDAIDEILQGMIDIADEVGNAKIADPVSSGNVLEVESWFSWNSLTDFQNNIRSIENCYINGYDGSAAGASLSDLVKEEDAALDQDVKDKIEAAINAIADIPEPFRNNLDNEEKVNAAMTAVDDLRAVIEQKVRPLFIN